MLAGARDVWINFTRLQLSFVSGDRRRSSPCLRNFVDVKSDFLSAECCPVTAEDGAQRCVKRSKYSVWKWSEFLFRHQACERFLGAPRFRQSRLL